MLDTLRQDYGEFIYKSGPKSRETQIKSNENDARLNTGAALMMLKERQKGLSARRRIGNATEAYS